MQPSSSSPLSPLQVPARGFTAAPRPSELHCILPEPGVLPPTVHSGSPHTRADRDQICSVCPDIVSCVTLMVMIKKVIVSLQTFSQANNIHACIKLRQEILSSLPDRKYLKQSFYFTNKTRFCLICRQLF